MVFTNQVIQSLICVRGEIHGHNSGIRVAAERMCRNGILTRNRLNVSEILHQNFENQRDFKKRLNKPP